MEPLTTHNLLRLAMSNYISEVEVSALCERIGNRQRGMPRSNATTNNTAISQRYWQDK